MLERFRDVVPSFNDDIQGTGAVALAGVIGACHLKNEKLSDQRMVVYGAGAGGVGVALALRDGLMREGLTADASLRAPVRARLEGTAHREPSDGELQAAVRPARRAASAAGNARAACRRCSKPSKTRAPACCSGFPDSRARSRRRSCARSPQTPQRPVIYPLSNPTTLVRSAAERHPALDQRRGDRRHRQPVRRGRARRRTLPDRPGQQRVHLPGPRLRRDPLRRDQDHRRHGAGRRLRARRLHR